MEEIIARLSSAIETSIWVKDLGYVPHLVINPYAGAFKNKKRLKRLTKTLKDLNSGSTWDVDYPSSVHVFSSEKDGHALGFGAELFALYPDPGQRHLVVIAAGDGTSHEALGSLITAGEDCSGIVVFRLPMGTGNDGADCDDIQQALEVWSGKGKLVPQDAIVITTAAGKTFHSFNIASFGLDAFVTDMTNKIKKRLPGSSYSVMVDIATLFYEKIHKVRPMEISFDTGEKHSGLVLFALMGVTGHRTYGDHKKILPDDRNICIVDRMGLIKKIARKALFYNGGHVDLPEVKMRSAQEAVFSYDGDLLFQTDGEAYLFSKNDFPVTMKLVSTGLQCVRHKVV